MHIFCGICKSNSGQKDLKYHEAQEERNLKNNEVLIFDAMVRLQRLEHLSSGIDYTGFN